MFFKQIFLITFYYLNYLNIYKLNIYNFKLLRDKCNFFKY